MEFQAMHGTSAFGFVHENVGQPALEHIHWSGFMHSYVCQSNHLLLLCGMMPKTELELESSLTRYVSGIFNSSSH